MRALSKNQNRGLAIGLLLLLVAIIALSMYVPASMLHRRYIVAIDSRLDFIARYHRVAATRAEIQSALDEVKKKDGRKHFLKNTGNALAASEIQEFAKTLIETNGGKLVSMQVVPFKEEGGYRRISINIQLICNMTVLRTIFYTLETAQPYLLIDNVSIRSQTNALYKGNPGVDPEVVAQFDLAGYALASGVK
ncbi:MAG: type II secretion system protein GspM [Pseudomonadota bacterium]